MCKVCSSLGQKWGNERAITGINIILTGPFLPKTLSQKLELLLLTLMKFNVLEFDADIKNRIFYTLNRIY